MRMRFCALLLVSILCLPGGSVQGHPLLGDPVYGRTGGAIAKAPSMVQKALADLGRQALHATELGFQHPVSGKDFHFTSAPPDDMQRLLDALRAMAKGESPAAMAFD